MALNKDIIWLIYTTYRLDKDYKLTMIFGTQSYKIGTTQQSSPSLAME